MHTCFAKADGSGECTYHVEDAPQRHVDFDEDFFMALWNQVWHVATEHLPDKVVCRPVARVARVSSCTDTDRMTTIVDNMSRNMNWRTTV